MSDKKMYMLIGPTGCGKTTFRKEHLSHVPCLSPDDLIVGRWTSRKCDLAWGYALQTAVELFTAGDSFVIDAMFVNAGHRLRWMSLAHGFGYTTVGIALNTPWKQLRLNQKNRGSRGFYGEVPINVQRDTYRSFRDQLKALLECNHHNDVVSWPRAFRIVNWGDKQSLKSAFEVI